MIDTTLVTAVVFVQIAGASGMTVDAVLTRCVPGILNLLGGLSFFAGLIIVRHRDFASGRIPALVGAALNRRGCRVRGGQLRRSSAQIIVVLGALITCAGFVWLGLALLSGSGRTTTQRAARVS